MVDARRRALALVVLALVASCGAAPREEPSAPIPSSSAGSARDLLARPRTEGLWPGAHGLSGVNGDPDLDTASVEAFCAARRRPCEIAHTYTDRTSYASMTTGSGWMFDNFAGFPGALVVSQGLVPRGGEAQLADCAAGRFDDLWRAFGTLMAEHGRAGSILRLGWEFNEPTMPWRGTVAATYISCFQHAATGVRATNPKVLIDWTINAHRTPADLCGGLSTNCYPGDAYVDIIGIDNYDHYPWSPTRAAFDYTARRAEGLSWLFSFAREHGKLFSVGEWGVVPAGDAGRENPSYVKWMHEWFAAHAPYLAYEAYFTNCEAGGVQSSLFDPSAGCRRNPESAAMYRSLYEQ
jgi:hypothetical protein